ncbi:MAG: DUF1611 domain-containing protein [Candidatus Latescibacteria bacterium]|nr:DUF1611 domain-containing protein [Candidatus Latescibacterota bacterium]
MSITPPYLLFLGDAADQLAAKTASGIAHWRPDWCVGQLRLPDCRADLGLADKSLEEARRDGAQTLVVGVANRGGVISDLWLQTLEQALDLGYHIASGLHNRLADLPSLKQRAETNGLALNDVRHPPQDLPIGQAEKRSGKRLLTVGTDCSVGKMFTALALEQALRQRGVEATFRATGQTGIFIAGEGISVDAVVADFISGATEALTPANQEGHWDIIEGQGSLFHPSYAGVSLGLLHGAAADRLVMCHEPTRPHMRGLSHFPLPDLKTCIRFNEQAGRLTNPQCRVVGLAVNTAALPPDQAESTCRSLAAETGLPAVDPVRHGVAPLVSALL